MNKVYVVLNVYKMMGSCDGCNSCLGFFAREHGCDDGRDILAAVKQQLQSKHPDLQFVVEDGCTSERTENVEVEDGDGDPIEYELMVAIIDEATAVVTAAQKGKRTTMTYRIIIDTTEFDEFTHPACIYLTDYAYSQCHYCGDKQPEVYAKCIHNGVANSVATALGHKHPEHTIYCLSNYHVIANLEYADVVVEDDMYSERWLIDDFADMLISETREIISEWKLLNGIAGKRCTVFEHDNKKGNE